MELAGQALLQATVRDITVQKRAEEKLERRKSLVGQRIKCHYGCLLCI